MFLDKNAPSEVLITRKFPWNKCVKLILFGNLEIPRVLYECSDLKITSKSLS